MDGFSHSLFKSEFILGINHTKWWIIKVKHPSLDIYRKNISRVKINNTHATHYTHYNIVIFMIYFYLPPADRPGTGDYKMICVRASVRVSVCHVFTQAFLFLKIL